LDLKFVSPWQFLHGSLFIDGRSSSAVTGDNWWRGAMGGKGEEFDNLGYCPCILLCCLEVDDCSSMAKICRELIVSPVYFAKDGPELSCQI